MTDIKSMSIEELKDLMVQLKEKPFRAKQIYSWLHEHLITSWDEAGNLPKSLKEKLSDYPITVLEMVDQQTANWEKTEAYDKMEAMLQANPDIEGVICGNDTMLEGVCAALQAAGKTLPVIGVDGSDEAAALIKSGQATGTALQQFAVIAEMAVVQADQYLKEGSTGEDEKQLVDCIAITAENVDKLSGFVFTE